MRSVVVAGIAIVIVTAGRAAAGASPIEPEPSQPSVVIGAAASLWFGKFLGGTLDVEIGRRLASGKWFGAAAGYGHASPGGCCAVTSRMLMARAGIGRWSCGPYGCSGVLGSFGYERQRVKTLD